MKFEQLLRRFSCFFRCSLITCSLFFISTFQLYATDIITNGTFDSDISTGWTNSTNGAGLLEWNVFNGGTAQAASNVGENIQFTCTMEQNIGTINNTDNIFLSLDWYKWSESIQSTTNNMIIRVIKPSGDSAEIWSDNSIPSLDASLSGNVNAENVSTFFDIDGIYSIKLIAELESGTDINAFARCNFDNIILDVQAAIVNLPPVVTDIPDQTIAEGGTFTTIQLDNFVSDPDHTDAELTWTYSGNTELFVSLSNRYINITASNSEWNGTETITFRSTDPELLWSEDAVTFTVNAEEDPPTIRNSNTSVSPSQVNRVNFNTTEISAQFVDVDQPAVNSFNITIKIREPDNTTELILVDNLTDGSGGLTVTDNGNGSYTASYTYNPDDLQTLGLYDLYTEISDGITTIIDGYDSNPDELELIELFPNESPTMAVSAISVLPSSIDRFGSNSTIFTIPFSDADIPAISSFQITLKVRAPYNESILPLLENSANGENGLTITDNTGGNYTANYSWDPPDNITIGYYDLMVIITDGTSSDTDFFDDNIDELLISGGGENSHPIIASDASYATPAGVLRVGANTTTIGAQFLDVDQPGVNAFTVTIKLLAPDNLTEEILANNASNGTQGISITDEGNGVYRVETIWNPPDIQDVGVYDIFISVSDGSLISTDDYANNSDELEIYDALTNTIPTIVNSATSVLPNSVNRIGAEFITVSAEFSDLDYSGTGSFTVTMILREPDNATEIIIANAAKHKEQGLRIQHLSGDTYRASILWDPPESQTTGTYDLYMYVEDNFSDNATDGFANNLDELTITSAAILGDGRLLKRTHNSDNCGGPNSACHNVEDHQGQNCLICHSSHDVTNIYLVNDTIQTPNSGPQEVIFKTLGIDDPYNDPDPVVGDPTSGTMADASDGVFTGVCEVCHISTSHHRNDGSQPPAIHHDGKNCISCHTHAEGFSGGESGGGMACTCHNPIFNTMDSTSLLTRHILAGTEPSYSPGGGIYTNKNCLTCHVDHDIFRPDLNPGIGTRSSNLRVDWEIDPVLGDNTVLLNSDYQTTGKGGICLSCHGAQDALCSPCHSAHMPPGKTIENHAAANNAHVFLDKTEYDAATSSHNYSFPMTFSSDGSVFNANCTKCHNDDMSKSYQNSANQVSLHGSTFSLLMDSTGIATPTDPLEEEFCFKCHSTTSNPNAGTNQDFFDVKGMTNSALDIEATFGYTYSHQVGNYKGIHEPLENLASDPRHVECVDCHNIHEAIQGTHDGSSQLVSNALKGAVGVEPTAWPAQPIPTDNANVFAAPTGYTYVNPAQNEYQICIKCHSNSVTLPVGSPNIAEEINPNYPSTHGITATNQNPFCNSTTMFEPWGASGSTYCSDCHRSSVSSDPEGPHGSNVEHLLVASIVSSSTSGTPLCDVCHRSTVYWSGSSAASRFNAHPSSRSAHRYAQGCFACHMWDYASVAGLGVPTDSWAGGAPTATTNIYVHGQNKRWNFNDRTGAVGSGQDADAFCNGYLSDMDYTNQQCWSEVCRSHNGTGYEKNSHMKFNLASTRLAFVLIGLLLSLIVISAVIPQQDIAQNQIISWQETLGDNYKYIEFFKLDQIYTTPFFFSIIGLLIINLIFGNVRRFRLIYKSEQKLIQARHLGSIIFHLSLVLLLVSIILNYAYTFEGVLALTEGQAVVENQQAYTRIYNGPFYKEEFNRYKITHKSFHVNYKLDNAITSASEISLQDAPNAPETTVVLTTNQPFLLNDLEFHYELKSGYSPEIIVIDSSGDIVFKKFMRLAVQKSAEKTIHADYYILDKYNMKIAIETTPNANYLDSTLFNLNIEIDSLHSYQGIIALNDSLNFGSYTLVVPRLRNWCYYHVVKSPYLNYIFASFWFALIGMTLGLIPRVIGAMNK